MTLSEKRNSWWASISRSIRRSLVGRRGPSRLEDNEEEVTSRRRLSYEVGTPIGPLVVANVEPSAWPAVAIQLPAGGSYSFAGSAPAPSGSAFAPPPFTAGFSFASTAPSLDASAALDALATKATTGEFLFESTAPAPNAPARGARAPVPPPATAGGSSSSYTAPTTGPFGSLVGCARTNQVISKGDAINVLRSDLKSLKSAMH
jgi:hypothetical protein